MRGKNLSHSHRQMDTNVTTTLFGMGLGSYPKTVLIKAPDQASATFSSRSEGGNGFVRLGSGKPLYLGQRVSVRSGEDVHTRSRSAQCAHRGRAGRSLCEKANRLVSMQADELSTVNPPHQNGNTTKLHSTRNGSGWNWVDCICGVRWFSAAKCGA